MKTVCVVSKNTIPAEIKDNFNIVPVSKATEMWACACIAIGGDGTVLEAIRQVGPYTAVAGINTGHLGFLTNDVDLDTFVDSLIKDDFYTTKRPTLFTSIGDNIVGNAINEVVIYNSTQGSLADILVTAGGKDVAEIRYHCDALIISTSTGSTAYNLSAGGSILDPSIDIMCLTPVAPFSMSSRSIVMAMKALDIKCNHKSTCTIDGRIVANNVDVGQHIIIHKGYEVETIHINKQHFLTTVQNKLGWNKLLKFDKEQ